MTQNRLPLTHRTASNPPTPPAREETAPGDRVEVSTRQERAQYAGEVLSRSLVTPTVDLYGSLATAQADGQLRGVDQYGEFNPFADAVAKKIEELNPREAAFEAAQASFPGADPQNLFRFVEAEF